VITPLIAKRFVDVLLVVELFVAKKFVDEALVKLAFVEKVDVAKRLEVKILLKRFVDDPRL
jgi:hypothetical protein